ncbi:MAG: hypothetical protein MUC90_02960 [Thermoplasmata archaeon]|nr:hypothetical protein [Thermoplasmata archaeon]
MKALLLSLCVLIALSMTFCAVPVSAEDVDIGVGDYWEYEFGGDFEGLSLEGTYKLKVDDSTEKTINGTSTEVFLVDVTGSGDLSGSFESTVVTGQLTISGTMVRLRSNFSLASNLLMMNMEMTGIGMTFDMDVGMEDTFTPVMDDYLGDEQLENGAVFESESTVSSETWFNILGFNESESSTTDAQVRSEVVGIDVPVSVTAGDFTCYKIEVSAEGGNESLASYYYYSDEVGNYVKIEGGDPVSGLADLELKSYSYSEGGGLLALFEDPMMIILIAVLVAVIIIVVLALVLRKRGRAPVQMMPPPPPPPA